MGDFRRYHNHYSGHENRDDRSRGYYGRRDQYANSSRSRGGHYSGSHFHDRGRHHENYGDRFSGSKQRDQRDYSSEIFKPEDWRNRRPDDEGPRRSLQHDPGHQAHQDFGRRSGMNMEALKYMERLRSSKPYLQKRKKEIVDSNRRNNVLEDEIEDIDFCLDVISDANADSNFNLHAIKTAHDKVLELVRNNPSTSAPPVPVIELDDDDDEEIFAPRSPSPETAPLRSDDTITVIPTERSQVKTDWNYRPDLSDYGSHTGEGNSMLNRHTSNQPHSSATASRFTQDNSTQRSDLHRDTHFNPSVGNSTNDLATNNGAEISQQNAPQTDARPPGKDWDGNWNYRPAPTGPNPWHQDGLHSRDQDMRQLENRGSPTIVQDSSINVVPPMLGLLPNPTAFQINFNNGLNPSAFVANIMNSSVMNQMMNGLQLTPQQQQVLAMSMVQNQAGLFSAASYPQIPNQPYTGLPTMAQNNPSPVNVTYSNTPNPDNYSQLPRRPLLPTPHYEPLRNPFGNSSARYNRPTFRPRGPHVRPYRQNFGPNHSEMTRFQNINIGARSRFGQSETSVGGGPGVLNRPPSSSPSDTSQKQPEVTARLTSNEVSDPRLRARMERAASANKPSDKVESQEAKADNEKKELSVLSKAIVLRLKAFSELAASSPIKVSDKEAAKAEIHKRTLQVKKALAIKKSSDVSINEDYDTEQKTREGGRLDSDSSKPSTSSTSGSHNDSIKEKSESCKGGFGSVKGYRIPKIKKPEIPEPEIHKEVEPCVPEDADQENYSHEIITSSPSSPVDEAVVATAEMESPESPSDTVSSTVSKHGLDADDLLKDYLKQQMQSLPADQLAKIKPGMMEKLMDSLKGEVNTRLQQFSKEDADGDEPSEVVTSTPEEEDRQVVSDVDDESAPNPKEDTPERKSRATTKKKTDEKRTRRSSLDKLHDALQSINFEAIMPLRPRRSTRGGEPEPEEHNSARGTRKTKQKNTFIELGAEAVEAALKQVQVPVPVPDSTVDDVKNKPVKVKRGRKRKISRVVIGPARRKPKVTKPSEEIESAIKDDDSDNTEATKPTRGRPRKIGGKQKVIKKGGRKKVSDESKGKRGRRKKSASPEDEEPFVPGSRRMDTADEILRFMSQTEEEPPFYDDEDGETEVKDKEEEEPSVMDESVYDVDLYDLEDDISQTYNSEMSREECLLPRPALSDSVKRFCDLLLNPRAALTLDDTEVPVFEWKSYEPTFCLEDLETPLIEENHADMSKTEVKDSDELSPELSPKGPIKVEDTKTDVGSPDVDALQVQNENTEGETRETYPPDDVAIENINVGVKTATSEAVKPENIEVGVKTDTSDVDKSENEDDKAEAEIEVDDTCKNIEEKVDNEAGSADEVGVKSESEKQGALKKEENDILKELNLLMSEQRIHNLEGHALYQCANDSCNFTAPDSTSFREHSNSCGAVGENKQLACYHCDRKLKTIGTLLEHLKTHGCQRQICTLCPFRCWLNIELAKHMKVSHKVNNYKVVKMTENGEPEYLMFPKDVWSKLTQTKTLQDNSLIYCPRVEFAPGQVSSIPLNAIFPSHVYCALCTYSTKVRSNIIRHLRLHEQSRIDGGLTQVPTEAPVNPVPHLERKELMFDKMTNWAGSTHAHKEKPGFTAEDALRVPQFVLEQFRYVCSVPNCKQLTGDDGLLRSHMKALHSEVDTYVCPHCQSSEHTKHDIRNSVTIDKIGTHLKLHGARLLKCGHCDYIHIQTRIMERHVSEKHPEKKRIHFMIRNLDGEGNNTNRRSSVEELQKNSSDRWRCNLCRVLSQTWEEARSHCETTHGITQQFMCSTCRFRSSSISCMEAHLGDIKCKATEDHASVMILFARNDISGGADSKEEPLVNQPIWRRDATNAKHIRGIYLEEYKERERKEPKVPKEVKRKRSEMKEEKIANAKKIKTEEKIRKAKASNILETAKSIKRLAKKRLQISQGDHVVVKSSTSVLTCPTCKMYKTTKANDFVVHLYNEYQYKRYGCTICEIGFVTADSLKIHIINDHDSEYDESTHLKLAPENPELEEKIQGIVETQINKTGDTVRPVARHPGVLDEPVQCTHCSSKFSSYHNFKTHIIAKHLAPDRFKCKHCPLGSWTEGVLRLHYGKVHPDVEFEYELNDTFEMSLTHEFWFKNYGIPHTKWTKGGLGRVKESVRRTPGTSKGKNKMKLGKTAIKQSASKVEVLSLVRYKCGYCSKIASTVDAVRNHWEKVHKDSTRICMYFRLETSPAPPAWYCNYCSFITTSNNLLRSHSRYHHDEKNPSCRGTAYKKSHPLNKIVVRCSYCKHRTDGLIELESHLASVHPEMLIKYKSAIRSSQMEEKLFMDETRYECTYCKEQFEDESACLSHTMTYHGEPMSTVKANQVVVQKEYETDTQEPKVTGEKPLMCPECEYIPKNLKDGKEHVTNTHIYPFKCPTCFLLFKSPTEAAFHFHHDHSNVTMKAMSNKNAAVEFGDIVHRFTTYQPMEIDLTGLSTSSEDNVSITEESNQTKKNQTARKSTGGLPISLMQNKTENKSSPTSSKPAVEESPAPKVKLPPKEIQLIDLTSLTSNLDLDDYEHYEEIPDDALGSPDPLEGWDDLFINHGNTQEMDFVQLDR